jgi:MYXO-CTERM domain-containing protein
VTRTAAGLGGNYDPATGRFALDIGDQVIEVEVDFEELTLFTSTAACADVDREFFVRAHLREIANDEDLELADARIIVDTVRPIAPTVTDITVTESLIRVEFEPSSSPDLLRYRVIYSTEPLTEGSLPDEISAQGSAFGNEEVVSGEIDVELAPGETVYVALAAQDETGNLSPISAVSEATALETTDFWEAYKQAGGAEEGGCSHAPSVPSGHHLFWLAVAGLAVSLRRRTNR